LPDGLASLPPQHELQEFEPSSSFNGRARERRVLFVSNRCTEKAPSGLETGVDFFAVERRVFPGAFSPMLSRGRLFCNNV
jgi:hypothetical protein